jgi:ATP-binding cassette subfamily B protein
MTGRARAKATDSEREPAAGQPPKVAGHGAPHARKAGRAQASTALDLDALPHIIPRILKLAAARRLPFILAIAASVAGTLFAVLLPRLLGQAVDQAHALMGQTADRGAGEQALYWTAALLLGASTLRGVLTMLSGYTFEKMGQRIAYDLRLAFFEKLQRLEFGFHDRIHSGDLITRGMLDLEGIRMFVENGVQRVVSLVLLLGMGASAMILIDPLMGLLALSFVPFVLWQAFRTGLFLRLTWTRLQQLMSVLTRTIEENLQGTRVVRAFAAKSFELDKFDQASSDALRMANERITIRSGSVSTMTFAFYVAMALVLWVGGRRVLDGTMTIGHLTTFLTFMTILQQPVRQVMMVVNTLARAVSSGSRLFEILDRPAAIDDAPGTPALRPGGSLCFEQVSFGFEKGNPSSRILSDISFEVAPGRTLGIVGAPGAGKSILAHLIPRFYDVTAGRITLGGQDVREVALASLRGAVVLVQQDVFLFDSSIAENIAYAERDAPTDAIEQAGRSAHLHDHVETLPLRYETMTGERGVGLSGGQRQRLSIARGIIGDPAVLILDDCTSAVDAATEQRLRAELQRLGRERITIIISHRLGSLRHADEIIMLDQGRIVERGTHESLLVLEGDYARLFAMQSGVTETLREPQEALS